MVKSAPSINRFLVGFGIQVGSSLLLWVVFWQGFHLPETWALGGAILISAVVIAFATSQRK